MIINRMQTVFPGPWLYMIYLLCCVSKVLCSDMTALGIRNAYLSEGTYSYASFAAASCPSVTAVSFYIQLWIMPTIPLPTFPLTEVSSHDTEKSCYVLLNRCVYDVTSFLDDHPGGADLVLGYGGKDVSEIMGDELSHFHSEAAYEILNENLIGFLASDATGQLKVEARIGERDRPEDIVPLRANDMETVGGDGVDWKSSDRKKEIHGTAGIRGVEDLTKETNLKDDFTVHGFLDLRRPLLGQVWSGNFTKDFYLEQVHRPRYYYMGKGPSAPLFGNALEPLSKTPWWIVPVIYVPLIIWGTYVADRGMRSPIITAVYWLSGSLTWPFVEYIVHRAVCHMDRLVALQKAPNIFI